jgi:hypothetical protein
VSGVVILGRDGMGADSGDEQAFGAWVAFVCERIDEATGLTVEVETRALRDVQTDLYRGTDEERRTLREAVEALWERWCGDGAPDAAGEATVEPLQPGPDVVDSSGRVVQRFCTWGELVLPVNHVRVGKADKP